MVIVTSYQRSKTLYVYNLHDLTHYTQMYKSPRTLTFDKKLSIIIQIKVTSYRLDSRLKICELQQHCHMTQGFVCFNHIRVNVRSAVGFNQIVISVVTVY